jgi:hypothetical protein
MHQDLFSNSFKLFNTKGYVCLRPKMIENPVFIKSLQRSVNVGTFLL